MKRSSAVILSTFCLIVGSIVGIIGWEAVMDVGATAEVEETEEWVPIERKVPVPVKSKLKNAENCYLCGSNSRSLMGLFRNYEDLGIICVNEWYVLDMRIRNHDDNGKLMGSQGSMNVTWTSTGEESCFFHCSPNSDRGISNVSVSYGDDSVFDVKRVQSYLCQGCLDKVLGVMEVYAPEDEEAKPRDLCLVDFQTLELYSLQGDYSSYYVRDYYVQVDDSREDELKVTAIYAPVLENGHKDAE